MENFFGSNYFSSYEDLEIHRLMLEDDPRTDTYRRAILENQNYFKNKVVMDVGCGVGILSVFCAQAGAKKVYAIEASNLANLAKDVVKENNFANVIEVIHSKVEDVILPDDIKVDAIVSEWMGFYLLHEGMLDSVLVARDKFLKHDGYMFPENASIYVAPCSVPQLYNKWTNFHGVSLKSFSKQLIDSKSKTPEIMQISPDNLLGEEVAMIWLDLKDDHLELDSFSMEHVVGATKTGQYQGICIWFEVHFPKLSNEDVVVLSTAPTAKQTHWKQTVILLPEAQNVEEQEPIAFKLVMNRNENSPRRYNLELSLLDPEKVDHPVPCSCDMTKCILLKAVLTQHAQHAMEQNNTIVDEKIDEEE